MQTLPIFITGFFDEDLSTRVMNELLFFENVFGKENREEIQEKFDEPLEESVIKMYINSPGGFVSDLTSILDSMDNIESRVETYCLGTAASCAAVLLSNGEKGKRFIGKNSEVLLHQVSFGTHGGIEDVNIAVEQGNKVNDKIIEILAKNTGRNPEQIKEDLSRDLWLNAEEAVEYGIVDKILDEGSNEIKAFNKVMELKEKNKPIETKQVLNASFEVKSINTEDPNNYIITGYASNFGTKDDYNDVVCKGAFIKTLAKSKLLAQSNERTLLWHHVTNSIPIGKCRLKETNKGLYTEAILPKDDELVKGRIMPQLKIGSIQNLSFGYYTNDFYYKNGTKYKTEVELFEVSFVNFPAHNESKIDPDSLLSIKAVVPFQDLPLADRGEEWDSAAAVKRVREFTNSEEAPSSDYKKAFVWYDKENQDLFGSYKLPIADVVDNRLTAIPRGIFAAAGAVQGARGGIDIPASDMDKVKSHLNRYYSKMDVPSPFDEEKSFDFTSITSISKFLKSKGLTNKETDDVVYHLKQVLSTPKEEEEGTETPCNEDESKSCNEIVQSIITDLNSLTK